MARSVHHVFGMMMLKRSTIESKPSAAGWLVRVGVASLAVVGAVAALATGCLDRNVCTTACDPKTSDVFVDQIVQTAVDKIDLLFMVDNSASMADKQDILRDAVPVLVSRLVSPICVDGAGKPTGESTSTGTCTRGGSPEFNPIGDIHIGIVSSSLGSHGGQVCAGASASPHANDNAHLVGSVRTDTFPISKTWNNSGFLAWDPSGTRNTPPGTGGPSGAADLQKTFQDMIVAAGEDGCGFEAQLESWYRFLIDPEPPASVTQANGLTVRSSALKLDAAGKPVLDATGRPTCTGCDDALLLQRKAFLRPDSLLAIVMLSDENDCSIRDDGVGWFVSTTSNSNGTVYMPRATSQCEANPNDPCCRSCAQNETTPPKDASGNLCPALSADPVCKSTPTWAPTTSDPNGDQVNLRCYNQKKRFGFDLLYDTARYVNGLRNTTLPLQSHPSTSVTNPLYESTGTEKAPRDPSLVFLAGIVGVPWQDVADDASLTGAGLNYLTAKELAAKGRWSALLGDPTASPPVPPSDPFMVETTAARTGTNTIAEPPVPTSSPNSTNPHANVINGHEYNIPNKNDLQYACTFPLNTPKTCTATNLACDCSPDARTMMNGAVTAANSPLCQGGANINTQTSAKAYPGTRELQVLKDLGDNAIVASICPKQATGDPSSDPNYGYNPAVGAIIERLKVALNGKCLPRPIQTNDQGQVLCKVMEAQKSGCDCTLPGRLPPDPLIESAVQAQLQATGNCGNAGQPSCKSWCQCEIKQETGADLLTCQSNDMGLKKPGYCYIDKTAEKAPGANTAAIETALAKCPPNQQQLLHFVDADSEHQTPAQGAVAFIACLGAPIGVVATGAGGGS